MILENFPRHWEPYRVFVVVQLPSRVQLFVTPRTTALQASLSFTVSWSLLKFMAIESMVPSNHLNLCRPPFLLSSIFPSIRVFSKELALLFESDGQSTGASASASILPVNIQGWFPLGLTGWISCCPRDSQESSPTPQFKNINSSALSLLYSPTLTSIHDYWKKKKT